MGLRKNLVDVILSDLPTSSSVLKEGDPTYDERLGGRRGPNAWGQYGRGAGTTCIITANGWLRAAGAPADLVWTEDTPQGGGTKILSHQLDGAKARGWLKTPVKGQLPDLRPGDIFNINHVVMDKDGNPTNPPQDGTHEGVVLRVISNDGQSLVIESADGGQGTRDKQTMTRQVRTFTLGSDGHPVHVKSQYTSGWLDRWIRVGGDEEDVESSSGGASANGGISGIANAGGESHLGLAVGLAGLALLVGGLGWWSISKGGSAAGMNAYKEIYVPPPIENTTYEKRITPYWEMLEQRAQYLRDHLKYVKRQAASTWDYLGQRSTVPGGNETSREVSTQERRLKKIEDTIALLLEGGLDQLLRDPTSELHMKW